MTTKNSFSELSIAELEALIYADYEDITADQIAALSQDKMFAIHIDWLRPSAFAGLTADNITGITELLFFRKWLSPAQISNINPKAFAALTESQLLAISDTNYAGITAEQISLLSAKKMHAIHIDWLSPSALAGLTAKNITGITDDTYFKEWLSPGQITNINPNAFAALKESQLLAISYTNYAGITAEQISLLSEEKMRAIHIDWLSPSALAGLTADNITGISDDRYFSEWISPEQMALINPAAIAALTDQKYLAIKLASINALTKEQLTARGETRWNTVKTEVDRFKKLLGGNWVNTQPLNDPNFVTWFKRLPLEVINAIISESNGAPGFGLSVSYQKLLSTQQISDTTGYYNKGLEEWSIRAIFKTLASGSTQADISQFNALTIYHMIEAMRKIPGDWVGIGADGNWVWSLTTAQIAKLSDTFPLGGANLFQLWVGPAGYENYYASNQKFIDQFQALSSSSIDLLINSDSAKFNSIGLSLNYQRLLTVAQIKNLSTRSLETLKNTPLPTREKLGEAAPVLLWAHAYKGGPLSDLSTKVLKFLRASDAKLLNASHMAILSELDLIYLIPTEALEGLSADAVAGVSAVQFNENVFSADEVKLLNLTKVKNETFAAFNAEFVSKLSPSQFASMTTDQLKSLNNDATRGITFDQINARYVGKFSGRILQIDSNYMLLNLAELPELLKYSSLGRLINYYLGVLFPSDPRVNQIVSPPFTPMPVSMLLDTPPPILREWSTHFVKGLDLTNLLKRFTSEEAALLSPEHVAALDGLVHFLPVSAISGLTSATVAALTADQVGVFSNGQVQQLNVSQLSGSTLIQLGSNFANRLTASQVQSLEQSTITEFLGRGNGVIANLSPRFFQALSDGVLVNAITTDLNQAENILRQLTPTQIAVLSPIAISSLIASSLNITRLMLGVGRTGAWTFEQFHAMAAIPGALALIDRNALANTLSVEALLSMTPTEISQLTAQQYGALLNNLTLSKVILNTGMGKSYWTTAQLQALAPNTIAYMTQDQYLDFTNPMGLGLFTADQIAGMATNVAILEIMLTGQINSWSATTIAIIVQNLPGMIKIDGLPGGGSAWSDRSDAPRNPAQLIQLRDTNNLVIIRQMLNSVVWNAMTETNQTSLLLNPNLSMVLRNINQAQLVNIMGNASLMGRLEGENLRALVYPIRAHLEGTILAERATLLPLTTHQLINFIAADGGAQALYSIARHAHALLPNGVVTSEVVSRLIAAVDGTIALIAMLQEAPLAFNATLTDAQITALISDIPGSRNALAAFARHRPILIPSNTFDDARVAALVQVSAWSDALTYIATYAPHALMNGRFSSAQITSMLTAGEEREAATSALAEIAEFAPNTLPNYVLTPSLMDRLVNAVGALGLGGNRDFLSLAVIARFAPHALPVGGLSRDQITLLINGDGTLRTFNALAQFAPGSIAALTTNAIKSLNAASLRNLISDEGYFMSDMSNANTLIIATHSNIDVALSEMVSAQLITFLGGNSNDVINLLQPTARQSIINNPAFNAALGAMRTEQIVNFLGRASGNIRGILPNNSMVALINNPNFAAAINAMSQRQITDFLTYPNSMLTFLALQVNLDGAPIPSPLNHNPNYLPALNALNSDQLLAFLNSQATYIKAMSSTEYETIIVNANLNMALRSMDPAQQLRFFENYPFIVQELTKGLTGETVSTFSGDVLNYLVSTEHGIAFLTDAITMQGLAPYISLNAIAEFSPEAATRLTRDITGFFLIAKLSPQQINRINPATLVALFNGDLINAHHELPPNVWVNLSTPQLTALLANPNGLQYFQNPESPSRISDANLQAIAPDVLAQSIRDTPLLIPNINADWVSHLSATQKGALQALNIFDAGVFVNKIVVDENHLVLPPPLSQSAPVANTDALIQAMASDSPSAGSESTMSFANMPVSWSTPTLSSAAI